MRGYHIRIVFSKNPNFTSIFDRLPSESAKPTHRRNATYNPHKTDYRLGPIRIDWLDKPNMNTSSSGKEKEGRSGSAVAEFIPNSGSTNLPDGVVRVFRDSENTSTSGAVDRPIVDGVVLGVLAVPSWMTPSDFLAFVAPAAESISHLRMIRDSVPNRSMVLIKFSKAEDAAEFIEAYNGKPFNSMEPELCNVVRVLSVNIDTDDTVVQGIAPFIPPQNGMYELPTCPVCLERMDSAVTGLITVPCSHSFHCMCLSKWGDSRQASLFPLQSFIISHHSLDARSAHSLSFRKPIRTHAFLMFIMFIDDKPLDMSHMRKHWVWEIRTSPRTQSLPVNNTPLRVGIGDAAADGKLVELPSAASSMSTSPRETGLGPSPADALSAEKIEAIGIEYSYLLTSQLDSQRAYYEEQTTELQSEVGEMRMMLERMTRDLEQERRAAQDAENERRREEEARLAEVVKDKAKAQTRAEKMTELARRLEKDLREERAVSEGLMQNLTKLKEKTDEFEKDKEECRAKISELEEQLRDVMFFLEAKTEIEKGEGVAGEAAGGSIEMSSSKDSKKKKNRR
ncbi:hypothetical protein D9758_006045 [Tetrapyrgos nigripes]|uniref:RING-type domain-containing protein n=1 Tax=Tetrapyrgos nigripes TaxID=182062 RepID=A0A8H5D8M9_9AGAR|nr:hypothetical protein D9758_006045 [Tetrapyrgos nigripes]